MPNGEHYFGWIRDEPGFTAYASTLEDGADFWAALAAKDDNGED